MSESTEFDVARIAELIGYQFRDLGLLASALTHASALPQGAVRECERLEFLGDAVLDLIIADLLLRTFPDENEGELSKRRSLLVKTPTLAAKAGELGFIGAVRLGRGEDRSGGRAKASILAAAYEALIGAIFIDGGFAAAQSVVTRHFDAEVRGERYVGPQDWKTMLQERTQAKHRGVPDYHLVEESGPAHARQFAVEVWVAGDCLAVGEGSSKREAEQSAARAALLRLDERPPVP